MKSKLKIKICEKNLNRLQLKTKCEIFIFILTQFILTSFSLHAIRENLNLSNNN